ncbi:hypothetical protein [Deinococcus actinosclerus]|uniref:Uncharacterized protein n=1 Tax=Deinococcus actinosclerus TaxID=1768108 RepID=A0ABN4K5V6_9DEIO|nr:hypothetical protein [Deinococcus actinosclerus]ALW88436.1 hypothetical protein AUC44_05625 [Deinococcus actinosclerus]
MTRTLSTLLLATLSLTAASMAAAQKTTLTIGGQPTTLDTVKVGGRTYVALNQLQQALTAAGGSNQLGAAEGCLNEWLFNGTWRLRVTSVKYVPDAGNGNYYGWVVTTEFRNGGKQLLNLSSTGIEKGVSLALKDGSTKDLGLGGIASAFRTGTDLPPGAGLVMDLPFSWQGGAPTNAQLQANPPVKLIVPVDVSALRRGGSTLYKTVNYSKDPSFRVNLTCRK